tara:strand:+ start:1255 stop:1398 length:144 start_codon:yes stop_codon:yes gene_type:complete
MIGWFIAVLLSFEKNKLRKFALFNPWNCFKGAISFIRMSFLRRQESN